MKNKAACSIILLLCLILSHNGYSQNNSPASYEPSFFEGSTVVEQLYSPALEGNLQGNPSTQGVKVYLPPGYDDFPDNEYPVLYLLHGYGWDYNFYYRDINDLFGTDILYKLNQMISQKSIVPMIIVTPNGKTKYDGSFYTNSYVSGNWEDYIVQEVIENVENKYRVLSQAESRGLGGHSMGGYGTLKIAINHPSLFNSISLMSAAWLDLENIFSTPLYREHMFGAADLNQYRQSDPYRTRLMYASAVAFAPDSSSSPIMGRLPYNAEGELIDSVWERWLEHDPYSMLESRSDSLKKLNGIQMYIGDEDDLLPSNNSFHQALIDQGIDHGYEIFSGGHNPDPVIRKVIRYFSDNLVGVVPTIRLSGDYYLENIDMLVLESSMDGNVYIVAATTDPTLDSIYRYQVATAAVVANEENEIQLSEIEFGKYRVFAVSIDSAVSNIPGEFCVVPAKLTPDLVLSGHTVDLGDPIQVSISRDGKIFLHNPSLFHLDTLQLASEIMNSSDIIESADALADAEVIFSTENLPKGEYWIYGFDQYGIVSGPRSVEVVETTDILAKPMPKFELFPNPAKEIVNIQSDIHGPYKISLSGLDGQQLYSRNFEGTEYQLDLSSLQKGVYFITIRSKGFITTRKIIKCDSAHLI